MALLEMAVAWSSAAAVAGTAPTQGEQVLSWALPWNSMAAAAVALQQRRLAAWMAKGNTSQADPVGRVFGEWGFVAWTW